MPSQTLTGFVCRYFPDRRYGFIASKDLPAGISRFGEIFFHAKDTTFDIALLVEDVKVTFEIGSFREKPKAVNVQIASTSTSKVIS